MTLDTRTIMLWLPDWPITAHLRTQALEVPQAERTLPDEPLAIVHAGAVVACSAAARAEGVARGQRRRDAQAACARLRLIPFDAAR
ncbi:MAG: DNA polymerase Y family protein, partial [Microbacterium gubbeenense]